MRRDSLFYRLFSRSPSLLFELLSSPPPDASSYRFDAVAIMVYRFTEKSRQEVEAMLGLTLEETRFYRDVREEGIEIGELRRGRSLIRRLLTRQFGKLPESLVSQIN